MLSVAMCCNLWPYVRPPLLSPSRGPPAKRTTSPC